MQIPAVVNFSSQPGSVALREIMCPTISDNDVPQTVAIELEPLDSVISDTTRMV